MPSTKPAKPGASSPHPFVVRAVRSVRESQSICCPSCDSPLNLIQPDEDEPTRLLGTCDSCSQWCYLVELEPEWRTALLVELPGGDELCREHAEAQVPDEDRAEP